MPKKQSVAQPVVQEPQVVQEPVAQPVVQEPQVVQEQPKVVVVADTPKVDTPNVEPKKRDKTIKLENAMQTLINNRTKLQKRQLSLEKQLENIKQQIKENEECIISTHLAIQEDNKIQ